MQRAFLDKNPADVISMFDQVGKHYDITNIILSMGQDKRWRAKTKQRLALQPGEKVLDLAAGTAVSTEVLTRGTGSWVVACDFSQGMLAAGRHRKVPKVCGDGMNLPFPDNTFDAVTISFGLRNIVDYKHGLAEMARVTKPGGRLCVAEFSTPHPAWFNKIYRFYLLRVLPKLAHVWSSDSAAYDYLAETILAWPNQKELAEAINTNGWSQCTWTDLTFGITALHSAVKPEK